MLARGGSAIDAAIAANAVLGVVEPMMNGIGGDLFAIYWDAKTGKLTGINASGWAAKALTHRRMKGQGLASMPQDGIHSVTVPGCVAGWEKLHKRFGRLSWAELFRPAIYYAENGFPVTELIQAHWRAATSKLAGDERGAARFFCRRHGAGRRRGVPQSRPGEGAAARSRDGARRRSIKGPIAKAILKTSDRLGGRMAAADLSEYRAEWVEPISTDYRGWKIYELPPNGQGMAALEMLNIMETFPLFQRRADSADALHAKIEAQKLAYADLGRYVADPRFAKVPVAGMLSKEYAASGRADRSARPGAMRRRRRGRRRAGGRHDLSYRGRPGRQHRVADPEPLSDFGSGVLVDGMGFHLHNRGALFTMDPSHPNALAPRKRPFHTIIPAFMEKGDMHIGFGIMGGFNQAQAHAQFVSNVVDHGMNIQAALEAPRFTKVTFGGCDVMIENRVPPDVRDELAGEGAQAGGAGATSRRRWAAGRWCCAIPRRR